MKGHGRLLRVVNSTAPIRVCDLGGWTDTWFARYGRVLNIAVHPHVEVQMHVWENGEGESRITINAENYGDRYTIGKPNGVYDRHPLLEAAVDFLHIPDNVAIEVSIYCEAPAGCSTGTSAAVGVALVGALDCLTPGRMTPHEVAQAAQKIETQLLHQQCGVQDQLASSFGGISYIDMTEYPHATVSPIRLPTAVLHELECRLSLLFVGNSHSSSKVHEMVIRGLEQIGPEARQLVALRQTPVAARDALYAGDLHAFGRTMIVNTDAQGDLHPALIGPDHQRIIDIARSHGAYGWKVNGAGGDGGSVTLLAGPDRARQRAMLREILADSPLYQHIPTTFSPSGLRLWESCCSCPTDDAFCQHRQATRLEHAAQPSPQP